MPTGGCRWTLGLEVGSAATLLWIAVAHLTLTAAPMVVSTLLALRLGVRDVPTLLVIGLAGSGLVALVSYWAFFTDPELGRFFAYAIVLASAAALIWLRPDRQGGGQVIRRLCTPWALWALASIFLLYVGFLHGGAEHPLATAGTRFSHQLPSDNDMPRFFAAWLDVHGHAQKPPVYPGGWLSSDRPPLQIGYVLSQRTFSWGSANELHYQVVGTIVQQLWVVGLWALLEAFGVGRRTQGLAMAAVLVSGVAILHGFFVWPKMLAATFVLAAVIAVGPLEWGRRPLSILLLASVSGLAYLAHGGSAFALIPIVGWALWRGLPDWRWVAAAAATVLLILVPWSAYQRYFDPPGDRVMKLILTGSDTISAEAGGRKAFPQLAADKGGTGNAMVDSYGDVGLSQGLENKWQNVVTMSGGTDGVDTSISAVGSLFSGDATKGIREIRFLQFVSLLPAMGLLTLAPFAMLIGRAKRKRRASEWRFATTCFALGGLGCLAWGLLIFGSPVARASIHVGSLAIPVLLLAGAVAGLRATYPRLATALVAANVLLTLALYVPSLDPPAGTDYSPVAALIAVASLAGFAAIAFSTPFGSDQPPRR